MARLREHAADAFDPRAMTQCGRRARLARDVQGEGWALSRSQSSLSRAVRGLYGPVLSRVRPRREVEPAFARLQLAARRRAARGCHGAASCGHALRGSAAVPFKTALVGLSPTCVSLCLMTILRGRSREPSDVAARSLEIRLPMSCASGRVLYDRIVGCAVTHRTRRGFTSAAAVGRRLRPAC